MGAAWCRERIEQAQNSKSPVDRIITRCSNAISAKTTVYSKQNQSKPANDIVFKQIRYGAPPVPVHQVPPPRAIARTQQTPHVSEWHTVPLHATGGSDVVDNPAPVPPPRKRRKRKVNSLEVLNSQLDMIYETSYHHKRRPKSELLFGDPLPTDDETPNFSDSSPERKSRGKSAVIDGKRKSRARKIMESKTKNLKNDRATTEFEKPQRSKMVKNYSAISLPSYNDLGKIDGEETKPKEHPPPKRNISAVSLPAGESVITALSGVTMQRLESYLRRCKSFGSLKPQQLLEKLEEITNKQETESSDSWSGLDDWDLGIIEYYDAEKAEPPLVPKSRLTSKQNSRVFELGPPPEKVECKPCPPTPPPLIREMSRSDNTFEQPHPTHDWLSTPTLTSPRLEPLKTPPPTPEEKKFEGSIGELDDPDYSHSTLLKYLRELPEKISDEPPVETADEEIEVKEKTPTPPRRRSKDDGKRRQSYQDISNAPKASQLLLRSMSMDATAEEVSPVLNKTWNNVSFSSSRHSLQQALVDFLGFEESPIAESDNMNSEVNLNSSLFPVIGLKEDKGSPAPLTSSPSPPPSPPPPLPTSPPPIQSATPLNH